MLLNDSSGSGLTGLDTGSAGKGADHYATGGSVDDMGCLQNGTDAVRPGSQVGSHTK